MTDIKHTIKCAQKGIHKGILVDVSGDPDDLLKTNAVFTVEFEYDSRLFVGHAIGNTVLGSLHELADLSLSEDCPKRIDLPLRRALLRSEYITVSVEGDGFRSEGELYDFKYSLIESMSAYAPLGYNDLERSLPRAERMRADALLHRVAPSVLGLQSLPKPQGRRRGRPGKRVFSYDRTGTLVGQYDSVGDAARLTGIGRCAISACCNGWYREAGGRFWSFNGPGTIPSEGDTGC